ncbi:MAG: archaeosortase A [Archaeoglobaceae archaeon]
MLAEEIALASLAAMIFYLATRKSFVASIAWLLLAAACAAKVPDFLAGGDYYNTAIFSAAIFVFALVAFAARESMYPVTRFSALALAVYFPFAFTHLGDLLILATAELTVALGNALGFPMLRDGSYVLLNGHAVEIILACTAIESMSLFSGATLGIKAETSRKLKAFLASVPTIYLLNLLRNVFVTVSFAYSLFGENSFYVAHHVVAKVLATIALVAIAYCVFKLLPELFDAVSRLVDELTAIFR